MRIKWEFETSDIQIILDVVRQYGNTTLVNERKARNLATKKALPTRAEFWKASVEAVLSSVVRYDRIQPFLDAVPFPLDFSTCASCGNLQRLVDENLKAINGFRFKGGSRAAFICANFKTINSDNWNEIEPELGRLINEQTKEAERRAARFISSPRLKGIGPKQSRNILQMLYLTRYEIPLDSRIANWMMTIGCPVQLSAGLADSDFYEYVEDQIQELCAKADIFPCVLDAAIWTANVAK